MKELAKLQETFGEVIEVTTPSGHSVVIRKQNGNDDDILSNAVYAAKGTGIPRFLSGIILDSTYTKTGTMTYEEVMKIRVADAYYLTIISRIFSLGNKLEFTYQWEDIQDKVIYEEDLNDFIWDYKLPIPEPGEEYYFKNRIKPITKDLTRELTLSSGKQLKYNFLNTEGEIYLMDLPPENQSVNQGLIARSLSIFENNKWVPVEQFKFFTPTDMKEIRKDLQDNDPSLSVFSEIENPVTKKIARFPIVGTVDFFFPLGT